ncbi:hypothetical protein KGQ34_02415 [Patescibacteria group bacterium]|nr:hypothetical protein [Patescibacteria group bacterium]
MFIHKKNLIKLVFAVLVFGAVFFFGASGNQTATQRARAADETATQPCDVISDPNCDITSRSIFPPGSEGEQLIKDTRNAEANRQTQSTVTAAANTEAPKYFCSTSITCYIVEFLDWASSGLLRIPLVMVAGFLDQAVTLALNLPMDQIGFVVQGWKIIRDVSNMFYVLILLWVALGTIFDFPKYNVREILPKLVISALLINFSLPLGTLVINTTNALANVFYQGIVDAGTGINGEGKGRLLADKILENTDFVKIMEASVQADLAAQNENLAKTIKDEDENLKHVKTGKTDANGNAVTIDCSGGQTSPNAPLIFKDTVSILASVTQCKDALLAYRAKTEAAQGYDLLTFARVSAIIWKLILIPTMIFVLFAAALFIFIRTISLAFLLIFGPFVFLAWALPDTRQYWTTWWDKLLKWSFFMPVLMFMLFLSITMMTTFTGEQSFATTAATQQVLIGTTGKTGLATAGFFTANMHFLFMLMLLIGSLTVAEKMGIEMATRVRGLGQKALGRAKRIAKAPVYAGARIAKLNAQSAVGGAARAITESEAFTKLVNKPVVSALGGRYAARTMAQVGRTGETAAATRMTEKYGGDVTKMRPEQQAVLLATASASEAKTFFNQLKPENRQKAYEKMNETQKDAFKQKLRASGVNDEDIGMMSKNPTLVAEGTNSELRKLKETNPEQYKDAVIETLRSGGFNFENASPEFITSGIGIRLLRTITQAEINQITATKEGAKAFADALKKIDTAMKETTETKTVKTGLVGPGMEERTETTVKMVPPETLSPDLQTIRKTGGWRALESGIKFSGSRTDLKRLIEEAIKEEAIKEAREGKEETKPPQPKPGSSVNI